MSHDTENGLRNNVVALDSPPLHTPIEPAKKRETLWPYLIAVGISLAGIVSFVVFLFLHIGHTDDDFITLVVPTSEDIVLSESGDYTIFHEYKSIVGGVVYSTTPEISGLLCTLTSKKTGTPVAILPSSASSHYSLGSRKGESVFGFHIPEAGLYHFEAQYVRGQDGPKTVLTLSHEFVGNLLLTIFGSMGILFGSMILAATIAIVTFVKRQNATRP